MHRVHLSEASIRLAELLDKADKGEDVVIIRSDGTSFKVVPLGAVEVASDSSEHSGDLSDSFDDFEAFEDLDDFHKAQRNISMSLSTNDSGLFSKIFLSVFLSIAVLMLAIAGFSGVNTARTIAKERRVPARVIDLTIRKDQDGSDLYYPVVEFDVPNQDRQIVQLAEGSWTSAYEQGESIPIRYDPERPRDVRIDSLENTILMWLVTIVTGILGISFSAASLFAYWLLKPDFAKQRM